MLIERIIELVSWGVCAVLLWIFVPKNRIREAHVIFFFKQVLTWVFGHLVVEYRLIQYPIRIFQHATNTSFTFEYFVYPSLCVLFNLYFPERQSWRKKAFHYFWYTSGITGLEVILEEYTRLIDYTHWTWYWTWITLFSTFMLSRLYYRWFFKETAKHPGGGIDVE